MPTTRPEIVAAAALKTFKQWIQEYDGKPANLKSYLLKKTAKYEAIGDKKLAELLLDILY
jgi:hypothetical protein